MNTVTLYIYIYIYIYIYVSTISAVKTELLIDIAEQWVVIEYTFSEAHMLAVNALEPSFSGFRGWNTSALHDGRNRGRWSICGQLDELETISKFKRVIRSYSYLKHHSTHITHHFSFSSFSSFFFSLFIFFILFILRMECPTEDVLVSAILYATLDLTDPRICMVLSKIFGSVWIFPTE